MTAGPTRAEDLIGRFLADDEDIDGACGRIQTFLTERVGSADKTGVVVPIDGDVDSAVATTLAVDALGPDRVFGLLLPAYLRGQATSFAAEHVATALDVEFRRVQLLPFVHLFEDQVVADERPAADVFALLDAVDRLRMGCAYYAAETLDRLVLGTADRTAWLLGRVTKYGVAYGDLLPLGGLYRTEVDRIATRVGVHEAIFDGDPVPPAAFGGRPESAAPVPDWSGVTRDTVLRLLVDEDAGIDRTADELGLDPAGVRQLARRSVRTRHKRRFPATPSTDLEARFHDLELAVG